MAAVAVTLIADLTVREGWELPDVSRPEFMADDVRHVCFVKDRGADGANDAPNDSAAARELTVLLFGAQALFVDQKFDLMSGTSRVASGVVTKIMRVSRTDD